MAIAYLGNGGWGAASNATISCSVPAAATGDYLIAFATIRENGATFATPSGWTLIGSYNNPYEENCIYLFGKWWESGLAPVSFVPSGGGSGDTVIGCITAWQGLDQTTPVAILNSSDASGIGYTATSGAANMLTGQGVVVFAHLDNDITGWDFLDYRLQATFKQTVHQSSTLGSDSTAAINYQYPLTADSIFPANQIGDFGPTPSATYETGYIALRLNPAIDSTTYTATVSGGVKIGGAGISQYVAVSGTLFDFTATGGAVTSGAADYSYVVPAVTYEYSGTVSAMLSGVGVTGLTFAPVIADATDIVVATVDGVEIPITQASIRMDSDITSVAIKSPVIFNAQPGQTLSISVQKIKGGQVLYTHQALSMPITSATRGPNGTSINAVRPGALIGGSFDPAMILVRSSGMIRSNVDFRVTPGCQYFGQVIRSVATTMGVKSPWFTEVRF